MGYWKTTQVFPEACEALALKVIELSNCLPSGHVLDVGHGCGDSLLLYLRHPKVPRPVSLTGITSLRCHHERSQTRVAALQADQDLEHRIPVQMYLGDAVFRSSARRHPLDPCQYPPWTTITAIDCAYHFHSRKTFLSQAFHCLQPGGRIALADLAMDSPLSPFMITVLSALLAIQRENIISSARYYSVLQEIGFENIVIEDISMDVFPSFRRFLSSRGGAWSGFQMLLALWTHCGGKFILVGAKKPIG